MSFAGPVFISYNHADEEFARWLAAELGEDVAASSNARSSLRIAVRLWEMRVGDSLRRKVERGIDTSAYLMVVLSPDSVKSEWVATELDAGFVKELEARRVILLPVLPRDCELPLFLRGKDYTVDGASGLHVPVQFRIRTGITPADFRTDPYNGMDHLLAGMRKVPEDYRYPIGFDPSSADVKRYLGHPREMGAAARRLEALRERFLAESVSEERLTLRTHNENGDCGGLDDFCWGRMAVIHLFPPIASLSKRAGPHFLDYEEYRTLMSILYHYVWEDEAFRESKRQRITKAEWRRFTGFDTYEAWVQAGSVHPFYDPMWQYTA